MDFPLDTKDTAGTRFVSSGRKENAMENLKPDWITEGWIDFEYQKYRLLAYLKWVRKQFDNGTLYPPLTQLLMHYENLLALQSS
ncbi:MAG: hypothetical protein F6K11_13155, partial [Leptolyngbya sp. SIO3F4]|nr:hypothetical protein [Leptolyngbya sp. SIO3F4]